MRTRIGVFALSAIGLITAGPASAEEVQLVTTNGLFDFRGELLAFDGTGYTLRSSLGTLTFPADEVICVGNACPDVNKITSAFRVAGGAMVQRLLVPELLDAYSLGVDTDISRGTSASGNTVYELLSYDGDPVVDVELVERDAENAFAELADGKVNLVFSQRPATDDEAAAITGGDRATLRRLGLERILAHGAIAVTTGTQTGIDSLSVDQLVSILTGDVRNWSDLDGADLPISVFTREKGANVREAIDALLLAPHEAEMSDEVITVDSVEGLNAAVATFPNSIGFSDLGATGELKPLAIKDTCDRPIPANEFTVKTGEYPLVSPVYVYQASGDISVHARGMVDFAQTPAGQEILSLAGYVDFRPTLAPGGDAGSEVAFGDKQQPAQRLSSTFRLHPGTEPLGPDDLLELEDLADYARSGRADGDELLFVGFGENGIDTAQQLLALMFETAPDVEERLTVGFRAVAGADSLAQPCGEGDDVVVQVWTRSLAEG